MNHIYKAGMLLVLVALLLLTSVSLARVAGYDLTWWTADSGGGMSSGGSYILSGTTGQPDAGPNLTGAGYQLMGGFWAGQVGSSPEKKVYLPLVLR